MSPEECRSIREAAGLSRPQLAEAIGVGSSAIKKYETGLVQISDERGAQITAACSGCSDYLAAPFGVAHRRRATSRQAGSSSLTSWLLPAGALLAFGLVAVLLRDTA
jgi:transcriptional regulator with XRE-family HTH domain